MKIVLSGASGFLGGYIKNEYISHEIILFDRHNILNFNILNIINQDDEYIFIHCAGLAHKDSRGIRFEEYYESNVLLTSKILSLLELHPPTCFVFVSSVSVYGLNSGHLIDENTPLLAIDGYGRSKMLAENEVVKWCEFYKIKFGILRLPLVVGRNAPGNLSKIINGIKKNYFFIIDGGKAKRSMVLAEDVARIILKVSKIGGIYNLTDGYHPSYFEFSNFIKKATNSRRVLNLPYFLAYFFGEIGDLFSLSSIFNSETVIKLTSTLTFDDSKAKKMLDWSPHKVTKYWEI